MIVSIDMTQEEYELANRYAQKQGLPLEEAIKNVFFEKVEDEYDIALADDALREFEKDPTTYSHEEVEKMLGIK